MLSNPEDDDELEHFVDAPDPDAPPAKAVVAATEASGSGFGEQVEKKGKVWSTAYDGKKREPQYANAQGSCLWELVRFLFLLSRLLRQRRH